MIWVSFSTTRIDFWIQIIQPFYCFRKNCIIINFIKTKIIFFGRQKAVDRSVMEGFQEGARGENGTQWEGLVGQDPV